MRFPYGQYDALLIEGPHIWPPLAGRWLQIPVWGLIDEHTFYFLHERYFPKTTRLALTFALRRYTGLFVIGQMLARLAKSVLGPTCPPLYIGFNGVEELRLERLLMVKPLLENPTLIIIAHGEEGWRTYYKGLDLYMETLTLLRRHMPSIQGLIVGRWTKREQDRLFGLFPKAPVRFLGAVGDIETILGETSLYLHLARGEAWGIAVQEAIAAGVPAIVSEWTGAAEVVSQIWSHGVVPLCPKTATERILEYFSLPVAERKVIAERGRSLIRSSYTRRQAVERFYQLFEDACRRVSVS
ncbi:MAG: glycosyltransferase family 4 protein [Bacteroidia bacterium]|nr:glycosyltransferase family 4 protein [Bacteroidia bacterium]